MTSRVKNLRRTAGDIGQTGLDVLYFRSWLEVHGELTLIIQVNINSHYTRHTFMLVPICSKYGKNPLRVLTLLRRQVGSLTIAVVCLSTASNQVYPNLSPLVFMYSKIYFVLEFRPIAITIINVCCARKCHKRLELLQKEMMLHIRSVITVVGLL